MPDLVVRAIWIAGLVIVAVAAGRLATRFRRSSQPTARLSGLGLEPGILVFTSTDCANCGKVMRSLRALEVPVREITYELESGLFESAGVSGVPLVVITKPDGTSARQFAGLVRPRRLRRALARAGW